MLSAFGAHTHETLVAPSRSKMSWIRRQARTYLAAPSCRPYESLLVPDQADQLPFISHAQRMKTGVPKSRTASARAVISASWDPELIWSRRGDFQVIIESRPAS